MGEVFTGEYRVEASDCDALGHMNVARYFAFCNLNGFAMQTALGWTPGEARDGLRLSFAVVRAESDFLSEVHEGEQIVALTDIARIGTRSASFRNRLCRPDGRPVFASVWQSACLNLDTRRAHPIPAALRDALGRYLNPDQD